jgi:hypothetical protein
MPSNQGIFFCDLSAKQREVAEKSSKTSDALARGAVVHDLRLAGDNPNLDWELESGLGDGGEGVPIDDLTIDLLAFAAHLYQADRLLKRPEKQPKEDTRARAWYRIVELHIGVKHQELWNSRATDLARLLGDITHDTFRLSFYHRDDTIPALLLPMTAPPIEGGICVFSTHFNSVFGIACQSEQGDLIASVRYGPGSPKRSQYELIEEIARVTNPFPFIAFRLTPIKLSSVERTQRTLGFLQFALAAGLARRLGLARIQIFSDAISSYHFRQRQICGGSGFAIRDTRPDFLWQTLNVLEQLGIVKDLKIRNPFQFSTAAEVLSCLSGKNQHIRRALLLQKTDSCLEKDLAKALRQNWKGAVPHCGCCFPCKLRRLAALAAGLETTGEYDAYAIDPLNPDIPSAKLEGLGGNLRLRADAYHGGLPDFKSYLDFFQAGPAAILDPLIRPEIQRLSSEKFFLDSSAPGAPDPQPTAAHIFQWIVGVHARFRDQVQEFFP